MNAQLLNSQLPTPNSQEMWSWDFVQLSYTSRGVEPPEV